MQVLKYKHTIVIPTFQRANLLGNTIKSCLLQEHDNYQVLVSNNFSEDNTREVLAEFADDPRVKVIHTDRKLSMPEHWEFVMDYVEGDYVMFIGDDDGVRPDFLKIIDQIIDTSGSNLIKFKGGLYYHTDWPNEERNTFSFDSKTSGYYFQVDPDLVIDSYCEFKGYDLFPNLLLTLFSLDLFNKAKSKAKKVFVGAPDWTCPFLLLVQDSVKFCYVDDTLAYGGRSKNSNAAYYTDQKDKKAQSERLKEFIGELDSATRFPYHTPLITTQGNFVPAAFSYAKYFYPERLKNFELNKLELSKVIQSDIAEEFCSKRASFYKKSEFEVFKDFVNTLEKKEKDIIYDMPGHFSFKGKILLSLKFLKSKIYYYFKIKRINKHLPWDTTINLTKLEMHNAYDLTKNFLQLLRAGKTNSNESSSVPLKYSYLKVLGRIKQN